jgi:low temperature requirement protein LtrA
MTAAQPDRPLGPVAPAAASAAGGTPAAEPPAARDGSEPIRVTTLELFFDLIFAFTLTQLAAVLTRTVTGASVLRVLLIFGLLWWMYSGYAWLTNTRSPVRTPERLLLVLGMAGFLVVGLAIPAGFGPDGLAFGLGYLLVVVVHSGLYLRVNRNILLIAPVNLSSALLVIIAAFTSGVAEYALWAAALLIQAGSPLLIRVGGRFEIRPAHFAERHGALVIVAIGESVAAIGIGAGLTRHALDVQLVAAAVLGLALSVTLWWLYFGTGDDEHGEQAMRAAHPDRRPSLAVSAYFYAHMAMLLGIVFAAAGVAAAVSHGARAAAPAAIALGAGAAAFVAGTAGFRIALRTGPPRLRLLAAGFALATIPLGAFAAIEAQLALITAVIVALLLAEDLAARRRDARPAED